MKLTLHDPPAGFEAEAEYRVPKKGETYLDLGQSPPIVATHNWTCERRIVLTPAFVWPEWLKGWGIVADMDGCQWWCASEPSRGNGIWTSRGDVRSVKWLTPITTFTPPTITDWTKPVRNPNYKQDAT